MSQMSLHHVFTKKGLQPLSRFRAAVFMTIANLPWLKNDDYQFAPIDSFDSIHMQNLISACKLSEISVFQKLILFKRPNDRTMFELETIEWMFAVGFKFFHLCPIEIKMLLIKRASYKCYGPGRWILKQGHLSTNMYLIVKGNVRITEDVRNPITKLIESTERCILKEKKSFGESAVMFNTRRINSVQSISTVELICISKNDFTDIIKNNLQLKWNANAIAIKCFSYFKHLSLLELNRCSTVSFIKTFKGNEYVLGKGLGDVDYAHFVLEGEISLILRLEIRQIINRYGNVKYILKKNLQKLNEKKYKNVYVNTCTLSSDSCFNIGEDIEDKEFITTDINVTKCLCVPHWFMGETEKLKCWELVKLDLNHIIPSKNKVFLKLYGS
ncbi:cAMP-dependent protein kinase type II-alpha regulatory subunit-like [Melanaphis sacchari]|uniref:cAMP-dependent protein kinase type II-alpha regulatory subunit-like n=1 Tax=Melanaphis sacchari TaxID=742174 RepID=UPI000DC14AC1|nr:cAMP-dependent protein kinase type II-alpha regulatory subunit-like [Melanaphis sacchari]